MLEFAEQEIVLPNGPHKGRRFRSHFQPAAGMYLREMDSGRWNRSAVVAPTQTGKSLVGYVIPCLYHLFEHNETVVLGIPDMNMANDKYREDILPVVKATQYAKYLPLRGAGSRSGAIKDSVQFQNDATLKFMSGGGGDAKRSAFTSRVSAVTETDKMDEAGEASRETDKIGQIEARTDAFGDKARIYLECTVSLEKGRIWQEYVNGTQSRIACPCPHCGARVTPEREHLVGWRDAESETDARERAAWACPECGATINEAERVEMNLLAVLVHKGQEVTPEGDVVGPLPKTRTLGFRWNAFNNLFWNAGTVGAREWRASKDPDEENAEKEMRQFVWALPYLPPKTDLTQVHAESICKRVTDHPKCAVPEDATRVTVGIDLGKWTCHWVAVAWRPHATPHVAEYGVLMPDSEELGVEPALMAALRDWRDTTLAQGWPKGNQIVRPEAVFVDSGWMTDVAFSFCSQSGAEFWPTKGFGATQSGGAYRRPKSTGSTVLWIGQDCHVVKLEGRSKPLLEANVDYYKTWLHARIQTPMGKPGAFSLHQGTDHLNFAKQLTAEKKTEEFVAGKGKIVRWEAVRQKNHFLDAATLACVAGYALGERLIEEQEAQPVSDKISGIEHGANPITNYRGRW